MKTTLNIRGIEREAVDRLKLAAHSRQMTVGELVERLIDFHDAARSRADLGDDGLQTELLALGLETVRR